MSEPEGAASAAPVGPGRVDPPAGGTWSTTHDGEWPPGFGPGHRDYDDDESW